MQLLILLLLVCAPVGLYAPDPCDFTALGLNGLPVFSHDQALTGCYRSVPFSVQKRTEAVDLVSFYMERACTPADDYDERDGWRERLQAINNTVFPDDYSMHRELHKWNAQFANFHFRYFPPVCYEDMLFSFIPLDLGIDVRSIVFSRPGKGNNDRKQLIYVAGILPLEPLYRAATGVDLRPFLGQELVKINGMHALKFLKLFARVFAAFDDNDGSNLQFVIDRMFYTVRASFPNPGNAPTTSSDIYVFRNEDGVRTTIEVPWVFTPSGFFLSDVTLSNSTADFKSQCGAVSWDSSTLFGSGASLRIDDGGESIRDWGKTTSAQVAEAAFMAFCDDLRNRSTHWGGPKNGGGFVERPLVEIVPLSNGVQAWQLGEDTTVIRVGSFQADHYDEIIAATNVSCTNSSTSRLLIDVRANIGGLNSAWLARHLRPGLSSQALASIVVDAKPNSETVEFFSRNTAFETFLTGQPGVCVGLPGAACFGNITTNVQFNTTTWLTGSVRSRDSFPVSELFYFHEGFWGPSGFPFPGYIPIACPDKFAGSDKVIILTDQTAGSAGYHFIRVMESGSKIVVAGGIQKEAKRGKRVYGIARAESTFNSVQIRQVDTLTSQLLGPSGLSLPTTENIAFAFGLFQTYTSNLEDVTFDVDPRDLRGDLYVPVWSREPGRQAEVYSRVMDAVEREFD